MWHVESCTDVCACSLSYPIQPAAAVALKGRNSTQNLSDKNQICCAEDNHSYSNMRAKESQI